MEFVVDVPFSGTTEQRDGFDLYLPAGAGGPLPVVVVVPGPAPARYPFRPRSWPVYQGYSRLVAQRGVAAVVVDQPYHDVADAAAQAEELARVVEVVRTAVEVDAGRVAVWAFSGGALLVGRWLGESPEWLRCLALSYPLVDPEHEVSPGRPIVLTRAGKESPERQATVDAFLGRASGVRVVDVPDGQHAFDVLDHTEQSRNAVRDGVDLVLGHLTA
jgi:dienelactone hydrolase